MAKTLQEKIKEKNNELKELILEQRIEEEKVKHAERLALMEDELKEHKKRK